MPGEFFEMLLGNLKLYEYQRIMARNYYNYTASLWDSIHYSITRKSKQERVKDEYRKFIDENKYGRITVRNRQISIPRIQCTKSNGNNIKYAPRRFPNGLGK
jgi:hypothetical protein